MQVNEVEFQVDAKQRSEANYGYTCHVPHLWDAVCVQIKRACPAATTHSQTSPFPVEAHSTELATCANAVVRGSSALSAATYAVRLGGHAQAAPQRSARLISSLANPATPQSKLQGTAVLARPQRIPATASHHWAGLTRPISRGLELSLIHI